MLDHLSHAFYSFPIFVQVGLKDKPMRPLAVNDLVKVIEASFHDRRLLNKTFYITGPEEMSCMDAVRRVAHVVGKQPIYFTAPVFVHNVLAYMFERTMKIPLVSLGQVKILSEGIVEPLPFAEKLPEDLLPKTAFTVEEIKKGLPEPKSFGWADLKFNLM